MNPMLDVAERLAAAIRTAFPDVDAVVGVSRTADPQFGDFQSNIAMQLAKPMKRNPREVASAIVEALDFSGLAEKPEIAGPGFINLRLTPDYLGSAVRAAAADAERGGVPRVEHPQTIVLDYSSPNVAKRLHVGHLRSTILGEAMKRVLAFLGHRTIADNHVGDWGTQFGLLIAAFRKWGDEGLLASDPVTHLEGLYQKASALAKEDPAFAEEGRAELARLQAGDPANHALWRRFVDISNAEVQKLYEQLDVSFDHWYGESFYNPELAPTVAKLEEAGIAREDDGALVVFFDGDPELEKHPFLVRKRDGAFLYSTTDIATVAWREREWHPDRVLYFVDKRQALHFKQLFAVARKMGYTHASLEHIDYGTILNAEGKPLKTRDGGTPSLQGLLAEGVEAAKAIMRESRPDFSPEQLDRLGPAVGIGAIKYADMAQNRTTDYKFDLAKLVAFDGNTGPYLQYTHARICSIFRRLEGGFTVPDSLALAAPEELALARHLTRFGEALTRTAEACTPNVLCEYLYGLARAFSSFYTNCPVLKADTEAQRATRLTLCLAVRTHLRLGLTALAIAPLEEM